MINTKVLFTFLKKINEPLKEDFVPTLSNRIIENFKVSLNDKMLLVPAASIMHKYIEEEHGKETADMLFDRLAEHKIIPTTLVKHDLSTPEGYMNAVDEVMAEMVSGAAIGGRMSGLGTNSQVNSTGLAGVDPILNKKKKIIRRFGKDNNKTL